MICLLLRGFYELMTFLFRMIAKNMLIGYWQN